MHNIKKILGLFLLICFHMMMSKAIYGQKVTKKHLVLKAGVGLLSSYFKDKPETATPPLSLGAAYHFNKKFSFECYLAHSRSRASKASLADNPPFQWENRLTIIGLKGAVHTFKFEQWDIYGGMLINCNAVRIKVLQGDAAFMQDHLGFKPRSSNISFSGFVGAKYDLGPRMGLYSELGFGASLLHVGIAYRLKNK